MTSYGLSEKKGLTILPCLKASDYYLQGGASKSPKHEENPVNKDVLPTGEQLHRSLFIPYTFTPSPWIHPKKETLISPKNEFVPAAYGLLERGTSYF